MKQEIFRFYFEPEKYFGTGYKTGLKNFSDAPYSPLRCPTQKQVEEAKRIGQKFRLWLVLHPDYFKGRLEGFDKPLGVWSSINRQAPFQYNSMVMAKMCDLCLFNKIGQDGVGNLFRCPDVRPRFFGCGDVRFTDAKTDSRFTYFPCLEWVKHV
ncbi:MAG: hypothetical protein WC495_04965 [Patescibacteria group bacterium]|jgi:hypothetical protein